MDLLKAKNFSILFNFTRKKLLGIEHAAWFDDFLKGRSWQKVLDNPLKSVLDTASSTFFIDW